MLNKEEYMKRLENALSDIRKVTDFKPEIAIVLGSGLGNFADNIEVEAVVDYKSIGGFPVSTAPGHAGQLIFGCLAGKKVVCMKGRVHYYEGYEMSEVVLPLRVMKLLGAETVILTNAVGCMNRDFGIGSFMAVSDCITSFIPSPLRGPNLDELGERFVDVSEIYDNRMRKAVLKLGDKLGIEVHEGVFIQLPGPQFETAAEIRFYSSIGADCAGMSTACEAVAAAHMGMRCCQICCITNMATGISETKLSGEEVIEIANRVSRDFEALISGLVAEI